MGWHERIRRRIQGFLESGGPVVPTYHAVAPVTDNPFLAGRLHRITPDIFAKQLEWLQSRFDIISTEDMLERTARGASLSGTAAITFDDGYRSVIDHAVPILTSMKLPATIYVTTCLLEPRGMLWRDWVRWVLNREKTDAFFDFAQEKDPVFKRIRPERFYRDSKDPAIIDSPRMAEMLHVFLDSEGVDINEAAQSLYCTVDDLKRFPTGLIHVGNHGWHHYILSRLDVSTQREEVAKGDATLREAGLSLSRFFSLPNGGKNDFNDDTLAAIRDSGYSGLFLCDQPAEKMGQSRIQWLGDIACIHRFLAPTETFT